MSAEHDSKEILKDLRDKEKKDLRASISNSSPVLIAKGLWIFAEGASALGLAGFGIYQARYGAYSEFWRWVMTAAGALVLIPAAGLLGKFFRNVGKA